MNDALLEMLKKQSRHDPCVYYKYFVFTDTIVFDPVSIDLARIESSDRLVARYEFALN